MSVTFSWMEMSIWHLIRLMQSSKHSVCMFASLCLCAWRVFWWAIPVQRCVTASAGACTGKGLARHAGTPDRWPWQHRCDWQMTSKTNRTQRCGRTDPQACVSVCKDWIEVSIRSLCNMTWVHLCDKTWCVCVCAAILDVRVGWQATDVAYETRSSVQVSPPL